MKIIYLANIRFPTEKAHGVHFAKMCEALASQKPSSQNFGEERQIELWIGRRYNPNFQGINPYQYYDVENNFTIKKLFVFDILRFLIGWAGSLGTWLINLSFAKSAFWKLVFNKTDLVYSRDALPLLYLSWLTKKKFTYELHEYRGKDVWIYQRLAKKGQGIVVITQSIKNLLVQNNIPEDKILVAADGVGELRIENQTLSIRKKLNISKNTRLILYTGSLYKWKGVYDLVQITNYKLPVTDYQIILVGGMNYDVNKLKRFIKDKKLPEDKIKILGHKPYSEIPKYLSIADVLVLPNSGHKEISKLFTSPMKMFEYMASGKPIIASDLPSISEVLNPNNSILVKPDSPESLTQGIEKALTDQVLVNKITKQALEDVKEYTWTKRVEKIIKFMIFQ